MVSPDSITNDNFQVLWVIFVQFESVFVKVEQIKLNVRFLWNTVYNDVILRCHYVQSVKNLSEPMQKHCCHCTSIWKKWGDITCREMTVKKR